MTRAGKRMCVLHALVLLGCTRASALATRDGLNDQAVAYAVVAAVALAAICREISHTPDDDLVIDAPPLIRRLSTLRARSTSRLRHAWSHAHPTRYADDEK